jgi:hypothetical protein
MWRALCLCGWKQILSELWNEAPQQWVHEKYIKFYCYIASVNTKRDWLICSHVALDKCNVSRPGNKWKIVARLDRLRT